MRSRARPCAADADRECRAGRAAAVCVCRGGPSIFSDGTGRTNERIWAEGVTAPRVILLFFSLNSPSSVPQLRYILCSRFTILLPYPLYIFGTSFCSPRGVALAAALVTRRSCCSQTAHDVPLRNTVFLLIALPIPTQLCFLLSPRSRFFCRCRGPFVGSPFHSLGHLYSSHRITSISVRPKPLARHTPCSRTMCSGHHSQTCQFTWSTHAKGASSGCPPPV